MWLLEHFLCIIMITKQFDLAVTLLTLGCYWLRSQLEHWLSWLVFTMAFLGYSKQICEQYFEIGHNLFLPILYISPHNTAFTSHLILSNFCSLYRVVNPQTNHKCSHKQGWKICMALLAQVHKNFIFLYKILTVRDSSVTCIVFKNFPSLILYICGRYI